MIWLKVLLLVVLVAGYIEFHEYVHESNCEYAGGRAFRLDFTHTLCEMSPDNALVAQVHFFDV